MIDTNLIKTALPHLLKGAGVTLQIAGLSLTIGLVVGTLLSMALTSKNKLLSYLAQLYVLVIRGTPMLVQIVFLYYVLSLSGTALSAFTAAVCAIGMNSSAYISQIVKSGIRSVSKGQIEAAYTLGISRWHTLRFIILPQALRTVLPALGNEAVTLIKDSSLASWIGVVELYKEGQTIISQTYDALSVYTALAILYLIMTTSVSYVVIFIERRLQNHARTA